MRWESHTPQLGELKIEKKFLYFPMKLNDITKWWEEAEIVYSYGYHGNFPAYQRNRPFWHPVYWKEVYDKKEYNYGV